MESRIVLCRGQDWVRLPDRMFNVNHEPAKLTGGGLLECLRDCYDAQDALMREHARVERLRVAVTEEMTKRRFTP